jgi:glycosyltransferase involved in cell wall biosynthesis
VARYLAKQHGWRSAFATNRNDATSVDVRLIHYAPIGGATAKTHYCTRTIENTVAHAHGVYESCKAARDLRPDLIVGHSGLGPTMFLRELYDCPVINYFEYFYRAHDSDLDFRSDQTPRELDVLRTYYRNSIFLTDLEYCDAGYSPTRWQKSTLPARFHDKVEVIFDGIDTALWKPRPGVARKVMGRTVPDSIRIVTYVSRGFESMRGFDILMQVAKRIYCELPNVVFAIVGSDRVAYGGDHHATNGKTYREHVLAQDDYDLSKFIFTGLLPPQELADLLSISDLHLYFTVPFVLSWSLFNALACGAVVVASNTEPVRELLTHGQTALMADFFNVEALAAHSLNVLRKPDEHRFLGRNGRGLIEARYGLDKCVADMINFFQRVASGRIQSDSSQVSDDPASP